MKSSARARRRAPEDVAELDFSDDGIPPRSGDPVDDEDLDELDAPRRTREAGLTGAAVGDTVTADDLAPETLLDDGGLASALGRKLAPADTELHSLDDEALFAGEFEELAFDDESDDDDALDPQESPDRDPP